MEGDPRLVKELTHRGSGTMINDFDFNENFINKLDFNTEEEYKNSSFYKNEISYIKAYNFKGEELSDKTKKAMITTNWRLIKESKPHQIHFNIRKLEAVIGYEKNDKDSFGIWDTINRTKTFKEDLIPKRLIEFLEIDKIESFI